MTTRKTRKYRGGVSQSTRNMLAFLVNKNNSSSIKVNSKQQSALSNMITHVIESYKSGAENHALYTLSTINAHYIILMEEYFINNGVPLESKEDPRYNYAMDIYERTTGRNIVKDANKYAELVLDELKKHNLTFEDLDIHNELIGYNLSNSSPSVQEIYHKIDKIKTNIFKKVREPNPIKRLFKRSRRAKRNIY